VATQRAGSLIGGPLRLTGRVQESDWGNVGQASRISSMVPGHAADARLAEFWVGAHPKAPSMIELPDGAILPLNEALAKFPRELLGSRSVARFGSTLPFLLKVLSVNGEYGLSIQLHPTKTKAEKLHRENPQHYPDDNHKPEVGVAITPVRLLYGMKDRAAVSSLFSALPELERFVGREIVSSLASSDLRDDPSIGRSLIAACFALDQNQMRSCNQYLAEALPLAPGLTQEASLFGKLATKYGLSDPGLLAMLLMRQVRIEPGQALFIAPNVPHAYLEGDLIECMACSDNVVRAGLTPKYRDVETLLEVIDCGSTIEGVRDLVPGDGGFKVVETPTEEFRLQVLPEECARTVIPESSLPSVVFCVGKGAAIRSRLTGRRIELRDGGAALLPPDSGAYEVDTSAAMLVHAIPALP
jgi:mannose-6-phosphate isomerase